MILFPKVCQSVCCPSVHLSFHLSIPPPIHLSTWLSACLLICLSFSARVCCLSAYLLICLSTYLSACLSVFLSPCRPVCLPACLCMPGSLSARLLVRLPAFLSVVDWVAVCCLSEVCCSLCPSVGPNKSIYNVNSVLRLTGDSTRTCNTRWWPPDIIVTLSDIDLKKAAKIFAQKYSCGSSVTGPDEIVIQGDVVDDLLEFIPEKWPEVQYSHTN